MKIENLRSATEIAARFKEAEDNLGFENLRIDLPIAGVGYMSCNLGMIVGVEMSHGAHGFPCDMGVIFQGSRGRLYRIFLNPPDIDSEFQIFRAIANIIEHQKISEAHGEKLS